MSNRFEAVIFDLDDTLYPERDFVLSGLMAAAVWAETRLDIPSSQGFDELQELYERGVRGNIFDQWLSTHMLHSTQLVSELVAVYREHSPVLKPFEDVLPTLNVLKGQCRLGLVTDGYLAVQLRKWRSLGLSDYFEAVVFSDELGRRHWKPSSKPFSTILERMRLNPAAAVYVGDNPEKDFIGARRVGIYTVWIRRHSGEYIHLEPPTKEYAADVVIRTLLELPFHLGCGCGQK